MLSPRADLLADLITRPVRLHVGQPFTFTHQIVNPGPSHVTSATGTFEVPSGWTITSAVWDDFGVKVPCTIVGPTSTCTTGSISVHSGRRMEVTVVPNQVATDVEVTATASSALDDDNLSNNVVTHTLDVDPAQVDLGVSASSSASSPAGAATTVDLRVDNNGPAAAADSTLTATLPASVQLEAVNTLSSGFTCSVNGQTLTCTHPLQPRGRATIRITIRYRALGPVSFTAAVGTSTPQVPDALPNSWWSPAPSPPRRQDQRHCRRHERRALLPVSASGCIRWVESSFVASATTDSAGSYS